LKGDRVIVVAGVDDSPLSKHVAERAIAEAGWRGAALHLVHVAHVPMIYGEAPVDWTDVIDAQRSATWNPLEEVIVGADLPIEKVDLDGYPPDVLVAYAKANSAGLLVLGTRGRGDFASLILGSTSHRALHLATCDVLVVKDDEARASDR
jgi:nucleotide-binding universal stress UspA family protein